jgi:DNA-binding PadR family transcriptional regulator
MSSATPMTTTSYAILGLLAVRSWTTHELVQQVDRSLRRLWPRAQSKLYEEPKKLVAHGYATASEDPVGRRRRTRYTITAKGRRALARWVEQPGEGPSLEFEQLVKIHFADSGTKADVVANLEAARAWVREQNEDNLAAARAYLAGEGAFPERAALNQLPGRFLTEFYVTVARWVEWATAMVETWPDDVKAAPFSTTAAEEGVALAESVDAMTRGAVSPRPPRAATDRGRP